jgi:hypothetical protein
MAIRYWLPDLQKHKHIALRFLPQAEYEPAAPLSVTPAPDVTTRVFMLFKGIDENEIGLWESGTMKPQGGAGIWRNIVGVDVDKATDEGLFRVLEWGGMEVVGDGPRTFLFSPTATSSLDFDGGVGT